MIAEGYLQYIGTKYFDSAFDRVYNQGVIKKEVVHKLYLVISKKKINACTKIAARPKPGRSNRTTISSAAIMSSSPPISDSIAKKRSAASSIRRSKILHGLLSEKLKIPSLFPEKFSRAFSLLIFFQPLSGEGFSVISPFYVLYHKHNFYH